MRRPIAHNLHNHKSPIMCVHAFILVLCCTPLVLCSRSGSARRHTAPPPGDARRGVRAKQDTRRYTDATRETRWGYAGAHAETKCNIAACLRYATRCHPLAPEQYRVHSNGRRPIARERQAPSAATTPTLLGALCVQRLTRRGGGKNTGSGAASASKTSPAAITLLAMPAHAHKRREGRRREGRR